MFILVHYIPAAGHFFKFFRFGAMLPIHSLITFTFIQCSIYRTEPGNTFVSNIIFLHYLHLSSFLYISLYFSAFLCISLQFSVFLTFIFFTGLIAKHGSQLGHGQSSMFENREAGFNEEDD